MNEHLEHATAPSQEQAPEGLARADLAVRLKDIRHLTEELFGGACRIYMEADPQATPSSWLVVQATTRLSPHETLRARLSWHRRAYAILGGPHNLRLVIERVNAS